MVVLFRKNERFNVYRPLSPTETFSTNPQYRVTLTDPDDDEDDLCTILIGLLQKDRRKKRKEGLDMLTIGYVIYKVCLLDFMMLLELIRLLSWELVHLTSVPGFTCTNVFVMQATYCCLTLDLEGGCGVVSN